MSERQAAIPAELAAARTRRVSPFRRAGDKLGATDPCRTPGSSRPTLAGAPVSPTAATLVGPTGGGDVPA